MPSKVNGKAVKKVGKVQKNINKTDKKKKERKKRYASNICKILKQVHPNARIPSKVMSIINGFVKDMSQRILAKALQREFFMEKTDGYVEDSFNSQPNEELLTVKERSTKAWTEAFKKIQANLDSKHFLLSKQCETIKNFKINKDNYKITPTRTPSENSILSWNNDYDLQSRIMNSTKFFNNSHSIASTSSTSIILDNQEKTTYDEKVMDHMDFADFTSKSMSKDELLQDQVLAEYEAYRKDTERNSLINEIMNLSGSQISELNKELLPTELSPTSSAGSSYINSSEIIAPPPTPIFQSEDISVEDSEKKEFTDSTINIHYIRNNLFTFKSDSRPKTTNDEKIMDSMNSAELISTQMSEKVKMEDNEKKESTDSIINIHDIGNISSTVISDSRPKTTNDEEIMDSMNSAELISTQMSEKVKVEDNEKKESTDSIINIHDIGNISSTVISDSRPKTTNNEKIMNSMNSAKLKSTQMSKDELFLIAKSKFLILLAYILALSVMTKIIKRFKPSLMITYDKARKDKKPEDIHNMKVKIHRKKCSSKCSICLKCFIILLILILSLFLFQFYFPVGLVREEMDENDEYVDIFATAIVELEEEILDHDTTVQVVTKYLERDTPFLKVIALIGDTSVDKPYTVDIIKKKLRKRRNDPSLSFPTFIVLENLRAEHSTVVANYMKMYQEAYGNREFTILAVFKVEQIDDDLTRADFNHTINAVKDFFIKANIIMKIIPYKPLSEDTIEKHIRKTAKNIGRTFSQDQIDYYKRHLIGDDTDCQKEYGC